MDDVVARTGKLERGGTVAVFLACDALRRGFDATIYTFNLSVFDPTWFTGCVDITERLARQRAEKADDQRVQEVTAGYLEFLRLGGRLQLTDLSRYLLRGFLRRRLPILTGLSATYLYRAMREYGPHAEADDIRGTPGGHFVVLAGYDRPARTVLVADPYGPARDYWIKIDRAVGAILLGVVTHDANLLLIRPRRGQQP
ncbi:MAG: hypothetical protein M0Z28_18860 [Rhodospirillales bacterium]|nr:hypothetical protein [Rhodospirillales bacterium]